METLSISKFKATCLAVIERVHKTGQPLLITKNGKPAAMVVPPPVDGGERDRPRIGMFREKLRFMGDVISPLGAEDWEVLK